MSSYKRVILSFVIPVLVFLLAPADPDTSIAAETKRHKISRIVVDPGHGGKDPGAIGPCGEKEKDITLAVGIKLAARLTEKGYEVLLTRDTDVFIPLEERTAFANKNKADLFISIHLNANEITSLKGIETYFLNLTTDASAIKVADRENASSSQKMSDIQFIIKDMMLNARINESSRFASSIHNSIITTLCKSGHSCRDHGVKQAPFYVLMGAQMPSILIETGFITNAAESRLLQTKAYQNSIIKGIVSGIDVYVTNSSVAYNKRKSSGENGLN